MKSKVCSKCKEEKLVSEFHKNKCMKDGYTIYCKDCIKPMKKEERLRNIEKYRESNKIYHIENIEKRNEYSKNYRKENPDKIKSYRKTEGHTLGLTRAQYTKMKRDEEFIQTLFYYSNGSMCCEFCKEDDIDVLSIDHINHNGSEHRKSFGGNSLQHQLIRENFPDGYRVLCRNCNWKQFLLNSKKSITYYS